MVRGWLKLAAPEKRLQWEVIAFKLQWNKDIYGPDVTPANKTLAWDALKIIPLKKITLEDEFDLINEWATGDSMGSQK